MAKEKLLTVYDVNGNPKTITEMAWKLLGKNKEGLTLKKGQKPVQEIKGGNDNAGGDETQDLEYEKLINQAKGFETDGKLLDAKDRYLKALEIKNVPAVKGAVTRIDKKLVALAEAEELNGVVEQGDKAMEDGTPDIAVEFYGTAVTLAPNDKAIAKKLKAAKDAVTEKAKKPAPAKPAEEPKK